MYARRQIIGQHSFAHISFRCHNKQFLLEDAATKIFLLLLWIKYKVKYGIKIYDFIIMDNHVHMLVQTFNAEHLGHFMRTVNSQLATYINKRLGRDSQAIRERYKSGLITNSVYMVNTMQYIWLNRYKVDGSDPRQDRFCSIMWRLFPNHLKMMFGDAIKEEQFGNLLDSYDDFPMDLNKSFAALNRLVTDAIAKVGTFVAKVYENAHTIGDAIDVQYRGHLLSAFRREYVPWTPL